MEYQLQKYYNFRVQALTHAQVEEMAAQVATIADEHHLTNDAATVPEDERRLGKREDHDTLPDEVKAKYVGNLSLLQRMRELHLRLRSLSLDNSPCPDSERYPFLKELISLDKKLHTNWGEYDHYVAPSPDAVPSRSAKASSALPLGPAKKRSAAVQLRNPPRSPPNEKECQHRPNPSSVERDAVSCLPFKCRTGCRHSRMDFGSSRRRRGVADFFFYLRRISAPTLFHHRG